MRYVLGIDFGGGASKATLLSENGEIVAEATYEYPTYYPAPGYVQQNPDDWYNAAKENIRAVIKSSGVSSGDIKVIALDAATHTAVVMDDDFNVLMPSIYWTDTRSKKEVDHLKETLGDEIRRIALHNVDTIWTLPQLLWIKNNEPEIFSKIRKIFFAKDYVRHCLTGDYVTDYIEAEGSMLFDLNEKKWSDKLCAAAGIDKSILPEVVSPHDVVGKVTKEAAKDTGLSEETLVICGTTDTVMEVFASGAVKKGNMTIKLATAGRICVVTDRSYPDKNLINYSHIVDGLWYPGTATKSCAASYRWYRDTFGGDYKSLDSGAEKIAPGAEGLMFHPYLNGELTPYADPLLSASFIGVRANHTKAHFTRALLEGVSMSIADCMNALGEIGIPHDETAVIIGGGGKSPLWRSITADMLGITLIGKKYSDSSFGSAMLAGVAAGFFSDPCEAVARCNEEVFVTEPDMKNNAVYKEQYERYKKVHDALAPIYHG